VVMALPYFAILSERQLLSEDTGRARFAIVDRTQPLFQCIPSMYVEMTKKQRVTRYAASCQRKLPVPAYGTGRESCPYRAAGALSLYVIRTRYAANHSPATAGVGAI
jgi:hypothetical protein